jgi:atypical dual specificity phosphatase
MSLIFPWLILGDSDDSANEVALKKAGVQFIMTCGDNLKIHFPNDYRYLHLPIEEGNFYNISKHCKEGCDFMDYVRSQQKDEKTPVRVLVHCSAGESRAPVMIMSYLMKAEGKTLTDAYEFVKDKRQSVNPNLGLIQQLSIYEQKLFGKCTKFGLDIRLYEFNEQFSTIRFKTKAFARSNLKGVTDAQAVKRIKDTVAIYKEYFEESIVEFKECYIDDIETLEKIQVLIKELKEAITVVDEIFKALE